MTVKQWMHIALLLIGSLLLESCSGCSSKKEEKRDISYLDALSQSETYSNDTYNNYDGGIEVAYTEMSGGIITIPVKINNMPLEMIFDSGASTTMITLAEAQYLFEKGNLKKEDVLDLSMFQTANGDLTAGLRINLRNVEIGDEIYCNNVEAIVVENQTAPLLLGQSVMKNFSQITVDHERKVVRFYK